jgi:hypothetical protein
MVRQVGSQQEVAQLSGLVFRRDRAAREHSRLLKTERSLA